MVSEDSDQILSGFLTVHGFRDRRNVDEPLVGEVPTDRCELDHHRELVEVATLGRSQRESPEEWDDHIHEIVPPADDIPVHVLSVVVAPSIRNDLADAEEVAKLVQGVDAPITLRYGELVRHLKAGPVAASTSPATLADEPDREASFSVYKTNNPASPDQPFLLIFRITRHIVTIAVASDGNE
jgi:hypothetical protein